MSLHYEICDLPDGQFMIAELIEVEAAPKASHETDRFRLNEFRGPFTSRDEAEALVEQLRNNAPRLQ